MNDMVTGVRIQWGLSIRSDQ